MNPEYMKKIAELWQQVAEKKAMDPVDQKALKGKHADRKDKDIDNDGDVDKSDEYLHNRRQAVSKAMKESEDEGEGKGDGKMKPCPDCDGSMDNHDPDCPKADNDDDDDMENESSCGKKMKKESVELDEGIMDKVKAGIKKVLGKHRLDKAQRKASSELRSYYDDWIASGGSEERFMELVHGTGKQMGLDIEPDEVFKDWLPKVRRANRKDDRLAKLRMKKESVSHEQWGYGEVIETTENGFNVYFEHGVEFDVSESELMFLEKNYAMRTKGAAKAETMKDKRKGKGADDMANDLNADNPELAADDAKGHEDATKAGRVVSKQSPTRGQEKRVGDTSIVNPVKGAVMKTTGKEG